VPTQAVFYRDERGLLPVEEFLDELPEATRDGIDRRIEEMNGLGDHIPPLPFPATSQIEGALRELRCRVGKRRYRIFYRRSGNLFVLLHVTGKSSRSIPRVDIELANRRWERFKTKMDDPNRTGPRPIGRDAP
jgi:phage-related protein